ncbi:MAG: NAD(P)-dependent glycerol-3-phosphate dehydrogenase [Verrucomicrobia bacterium]|nr:NAD(P)-dependent glycerol-3-phosphate dehydrogenase [Verrucomicrobiota bacterium]
MARITCLGAGGWGTALALLANQNGHEVTLWCRRPGFAGQLRRERVNEIYLPGVPLPSGLDMTSDLDSAVARAEVVIWAVPSSGLREVAAEIHTRRALPAAAVFVSTVKGIESGTDLRMSQVLGQIFPAHPATVLSGPNHAEEVARGVPSATVLAGPAGLARRLQQMLASDRFRIYTSSDLPGVELGGALKNIFALAAGMSDGLGFGDNSKAALVTRALAEMVRLGTVLGGRRETFYGLSGMGDLTVTAFSRHSRNRRVGERLAQGETLGAVTQSMRMVAEGVNTTRAALALAQRHRIDAPITQGVHSVLYEGERVGHALQRLLERGLRSEEE